MYYNSDGGRIKTTELRVVCVMRSISCTATQNRLNIILVGETAGLNRKLDYVEQQCENMKKLGILSDTHDHLDRIRAAVVLLETNGAEGLLHLGDFIAPFALKLVLQFHGPVYAIFGNNDGEKRGLKKLFGELRDGPHVFEIGGRKIGVAHSVEEIPAEYRAICDAIMYGHSHERVLKPRVGLQPLELNPGEGCGWLTGKPSCAILNLESMNAEILEIQ